MASYTAIEPTFFNGHLRQPGDKVEALSSPGSSWVLSTLYTPFDPTRKQTVAPAADGGFMRNSSLAGKGRHPRDDSRGAGNPQRAVEVGRADPRHAWKF